MTENIYVYISLILAFLAGIGLVEIYNFIKKVMK